MDEREQKDGQRRGGQVYYLVLCESLPKGSGFKLQCLAVLLGLLERDSPHPFVKQMARVPI